MNDEVVTMARSQTAIMLLAYHQAVNSLLNELLDSIPQQYPYGRQASQAVRRFRTKVQRLALSWYQS